MSEYEGNALASRKRLHGDEFSDISDAVYRWYNLARECNMLVSGPMLQEKVCVIVVQMGNPQFKASMSPMICYILKLRMKRRKLLELHVCSMLSL